MRLLICICFLALFSSCFQTERNCSDYKIGTFEFSYLDNGVEKTAKFTRTEDYSIDFIEGKADSSSVRWINDCEFILKKLHPKSTQEAKAIHMKILNTTDNSYTFEYTYAVKEQNRSNRVEKGVATKID